MFQTSFHFQMPTKKGTFRELLLFFHCKLNGEQTNESEFKRRRKQARLYSSFWAKWLKLNGQF